ncbi:MAG: dihydrolipoyl dehydrogenase, partial [Chlamydiota bacterium]
PTKVLLSNSGILDLLKKASTYGIETGPITFSYEKMVQKKNQIVASLAKNLEGLLQSNQITIYRGSATFISPKIVQISDHGPVEGEKIIIATGSIPASLSFCPVDGEKILDSTSILQITTLPKTLAIIGGGYIGCEFASLFSSLGVKVTIIESLDSLVAAHEPLISQELKKAFIKKGIEVRTTTKVISVEKKDQVHLTLSSNEILTTEKVLVAIGRKIDTHDLELHKANILLTEQGAIQTNEYMETSTPGIYAIGDVVGKWMLAHVASHQGSIAVSHACGNSKKMDYNAIPSVIFTDPEIASVGMTLSQAKENSLQAVSHLFPFKALGKAIASSETEGFVLLISEEKTQKVLGAHMIGKNASTLIGEMTLAIQHNLSIEDICDTIHPHPTLSEAWLEVAFLAYGTPLHLPPIKKK